MSKNPSLLDSLKELENLSTIDTVDPEDEDFETGKLSKFHETLDEETKGRIKFDDLRKAAAENEESVEKKYAGKRSSRKSLMEWIDEENDDNSSDGNVDVVDDGDVEVGNNTGDVESENEEVESEGEIIDSKLEHIYVVEKVDINNQRKEQFGEESNTGVDTAVMDDKFDEESDECYEEEDEEDEEYGKDSNEGEDDDNIIDFSKLPNDLITDSQDGKDCFPHFTSVAPKDDLEKGKCTQSQLDILDKLLESRIRLQKSLQICNQLPQHDMMHKFKGNAGPQIADSYETAKTSMKGLLNQLLKFHEVLCDSNSETSSILKTGEAAIVDPEDEEIPSDTDDEEDNEKSSGTSEKEKGNSLNLPTKRKHTLTVEEYGEEISKRHKALGPFYDSTIKKWHEKTRLASNLINKKNFAAFDKSALQQIKQVLMDKERLIKRTQLSRVPLHILGTNNDHEEDVQDDTSNLHLKNYNENIFDDADFYHEMLKELIERKSSVDGNDPIAASRRWLELQKLRSKIKRKVDTRASKGRKVRYDVHTKLVNFMAPHNVGTMGDQARNNLFASLFGQKHLM